MSTSINQTPIQNKDLRRRTMFPNTVEATPLRRRSSNKTTGAKSVVLLEKINDDEDERFSRRNIASEQRRLSNIPHGTPTLNESNRFLMQQAMEDFQICNKLFLENKINSKNAWGLRIIDILNLMAQQTSSDTLQVAGTSLDISAKVYGIRVDDLHSKGLKLANNMARTAAGKKLPQDLDNGNEDGNDDPSGENPTAKENKKKKKRGFCRKRNTIVKDPKSLLAPLPKLESVSFSTRTSTESSATDNLFTNKIKMDPTSHKFVLFSQEKAWIDLPDPVVKDGLDCKKYPLRINRTLVPLRNRQLCAPFNDFHIDEWDPDDEAQQLAVEKSIQQEIILDDNGIPIPELDGSIHDIFANDPDQEEGMDVANNSNEEAAPQLRGEIAKITEFRPDVIGGSQRSQFSYNTLVTTNSGLCDQVWAGPSHWKLKFLRRPPVRSSQQVSTEVKQIKQRKKKAKPQRVDFTVECEEFDYSKKYKKKKLPTVDFHKVTLPIPDILFLKDLEHVRELIAKPGVLHVMKNLTVNYEVDTYNYTNPNDSQYCPQQNDNNSVDDGFDNNACGDIQEEQEHVCAQQNFLGDNLVDAPEEVPKSYVPYALQAKKMDMKKLKTAIWKKLTNDTSARDTQPTQQSGKVVPMNFSKMYKQVPDLLPEKMRQELTCPLAFVALLHLCNEKNLNLQQHEGSKDFLIRGPEV